MTDKKAKALEGLRKIATQLTEDVVEGNPTKRIHTHVWGVLRNIEILVEEYSFTGARERDVSEDAPTQADPAKFPGGKHRKTEEGDPSVSSWQAIVDTITQTADVANQMVEQMAKKTSCIFYGDYGGDCAQMNLKVGHWCPVCHENEAVAEYGLHVPGFSELDDVLVELKVMRARCDEMITYLTFALEDS